MPKTPGGCHRNLLNPFNYVSSDNLEKDPLLKGAGQLNFHLNEGSHAIDAGTPEKPIATDIEGTTRPEGKGYDLGAYEYHTSR